jgi:hypothetical protein
MPIARTERNPLPTSMPYRASGPAARAAQDVDPRWLLVERIIESRSLGKSELLARFLRYVCDRQIRDRAYEITEQQIGVKVFGRPEGYNSNDDNIVRSYARTLRKRLDDYFKREGWEEAVVLRIPRGGYVPVFSLRSGPDHAQLESAQVSDVELEAHGDFDEERAASLSSSTSVAFHEDEMHPGTLTEVAPAPARRLRSFAGSTLLCATMCILGYFAGRGKSNWLPFRSHVAQANRLLWSQLFSDERDTFIVPADGGLVMMQSFIKKKVGLPEYITGSYRSDTEIDHGVRGLLETAHPEDQAQLVRKVSVLAARRYTSVADLDLAAKLAQLKAVVPERLVIRFARDLRMDDLHTGNAILLGSSDANPWVSLFEQQLNFQFSRGIEFGGSGTIRNTRPLPGEQTEYASITGDPSNATYGVIAYVPNLENTGHVLLIEGVNMAGTQAAGEFLLRPEQMQPMLDRAVDSHGRLQAFEILLKTTNIAANASGAQVLSERVHTSVAP